MGQPEDTRPASLKMKASERRCTWRPLEISYDPLKHSQRANKYVTRETAQRMAPMRREQEGPIKANWVAPQSQIFVPELREILPQEEK